MAWEKDLFTIPGAEAAADLSANLYFCVKKDTTANRFALCDTDGEPFDGVLQNKPDTTGLAASVRAAGVTKLEAGEALAAGDYWGTDSAGKAKKIEDTVTGADVGDYVAGRILVGAASGELAIGTIGLMTFRVESQ